MGKGICSDCEYRHCNCGFPKPWKTNKLCKHWKLGGCYVCKYYKDGELTEEETDEWFRRGCEAWFPTKKYCSKFKRDWKKTIKKFIRGR